MNKTILPLLILCLSALGARELQLLLLPGRDEGAAELRRDVPVIQLIDAAGCPQGYTRFALWGDLTGVLYKDDTGAACLLEWSGQVLPFGGENPWQ